MTSPHNILDRLSEIRTKYGSKFEKQKFLCLSIIRKHTFVDATLLRKYHDLLLFLEAFPDSKRVYLLAAAELRRLAKIAQTLCQKSKKANKELAKSSVSGSTIQTSLSLSASNWISSRSTRNFQIDFASLEDTETFESFIRDSTKTLLSEAILDSSVPTEDWVNQLGAKSGAKWLFQLFPEKESVVAERAFESLGLWFNWKLDYRSSITGNRFPKRKIFVHGAALRTTESVTETLKKSLPKKYIRKPQELIDSSRLALFTRGRETDPVVYPKQSSVTLYRLEHGLDIALLGCIPERRRALETFIGYVAAKNRVPCAYGGSWIFGKRADIGVNVFDQFRGGDSLSLFSQLLRVYHQRYGVEIFEVEPYQFGTAEGIQSGAFWFYWKIGFRPIEDKLLKLAEGEWIKMQRRKLYRVPASTLRRLSRDKLRFTLDKNVTVPPASVKLGSLVSRLSADKFGGDVLQCEDFYYRKLVKSVDHIQPKKLSTEELTALKRVSPLLALSPAVRSWTRADKRRILQILAAKGGLNEDRYTKALASSPELINALRQLIE